MAEYQNRKARILDHLSNYRFHVLDVSFNVPVVLNLSYGFARVTMPEISIESREIKQGVDPYVKHVAMAVNVNEITLEQGVSIFNSDFYDWIDSVIRGRVGTRRNLLLVQFSELAVANGRISGNIAPRGVSLVNFNDLVGRMPAKAWLLKGCIPTAYKAGSDLDALGNDISIATLTVKPHTIVELNLGL